MSDYVMKSIAIRCNSDGATYFKTCSITNKMYSVSIPMRNFVEYRRDPNDYGYNAPESFKKMAKTEIQHVLCKEKGCDITPEQREFILTSRTPAEQEAHHEYIMQSYHEMGSKFTSVLYPIGEQPEYKRYPEYEVALKKAYNQWYADKKWDDYLQEQAVIDHEQYVRDMMEEDVITDEDAGNDIHHLPGENN